MVTSANMGSYGAPRLCPPGKTTNKLAKFVSINFYRTLVKSSQKLTIAKVNLIGERNCFTAVRVPWHFTSPVYLPPPSRMSEAMKKTA